MGKYYAAYKSMPSEIAIFNSKKERDEWVNHEDWFSREFPPAEKERIPLTEKQAYSIAGELLHNTNEHIKDNIIENMMWIISKPSVGGVAV